MYLTDEGQVGKWMLFFDNNRVNSAWKMATDLFYNGELYGVFAIKMGTNTFNERASSRDNKVAPSAYSTV